MTRKLGSGTPKAQAVVDGVIADHIQADGFARSELRPLRTHLT
jgi:hypothetical protein